MKQHKGSTNPWQIQPLLPQIWIKRQTWDVTGHHKVSDEPLISSQATKVMRLSFSISGEARKKSSSRGIRRGCLRTITMRQITTCRWAIEQVPRLAHSSLLNSTMGMVGVFHSTTRNRCHHRTPSSLIIQAGSRVVLARTEWCRVGSWSRPSNSQL